MLSQPMSLAKYIERIYVCISQNTEALGIHNKYFYQEQTSIPKSEFIQSRIISYVNRKHIKQHFCQTAILDTQNGLTTRVYSACPIISCNCFISISFQTLSPAACGRKVFFHKWRWPNSISLKMVETNTFLVIFPAFNWSCIHHLCLITPSSTYTPIPWAPYLQAPQNTC